MRTNLAQLSSGSLHGVVLGWPGGPVPFLNIAFPQKNQRGGPTLSGGEREGHAHGDLTLFLNQYQNLYRAVQRV